MIIGAVDERRVAVQHLSGGGRARARDAVMIDAGGPVEPLLALIDRMRYRLAHVLLTHHHHDRVAEALDGSWPASGYAGPDPRAGARSSPAGHRHHGARRARSTRGALQIVPLHARPYGGDDLAAGRGRRRVHRGHAVQGLGGRGAGPRTLDLRGPARIDHGHPADASTVDADPSRVTDPTTVADELEQSSSMASGAAPTPRATGPAPRMGEPATLILLGDDYDGGHKAWVRWPDGSDDIVPGSQVELETRRPPEQG